MTILYYILMLLGLLCTIPVGMKLLGSDRISMELTVMFHIGAAAVFTVGIHNLTSKKDVSDKKCNLWWSYALTCGLVLPCYGLYIAFFTYLIQRIMNKRPPSIEDEEITVQDVGVFGKDTKLPKQLEILNRLDIEPFSDIFGTGRSRLKKSAIELLGNIRSEQAIKILRVALMDDDIEVRLFAAGVLGRIDDEHTKNIREKAAQFEDDPLDQDAGMELVKTCKQYAESGLLEAISQTYYYKKGIDTLGELKRTAEALYLKSYLEEKLGNLDGAFTAISACLKNNDKKGKFHEQLWNIMFQRRDYAEIAKNVSLAKNRGIEGINEGIIEYWEGDGDIH